MVWGEPLADTEAMIQRVRAAAARYGRSPRFSVSFRPILGPTEEAAWARAHAIHGAIVGKGRAAAHAAERRLAAPAGRGHARRGPRPLPLDPDRGGDRRRGNTTALVGTPETVAEAMADYYKIGVNTILIRGFDPLNDAIQYGAELLPLVREKVAAFDAAAAEPVPVAAGR